MRKVALDRDNKPNCQLPKETKEITMIKTASTEGNNKWTIGVAELDNQAYISCWPGEVDQVYTKGIAAGCGIGKILMMLCLNEESIHNVENIEENEAIKDIADVESLKKWVNSECSKLVFLIMAAEPKSAAHMYFNSAMEIGYTKMFIEISPVPGAKKYYPQNIPGSVQDLKKLYTVVDNFGYIVDGEKKVPAWGKSWFFCFPKPQQPKPTQKSTQMF